MTPLLADPLPREPFTPFPRIKRRARVFLFFVLILTGISPAQAALYQTIGVNVMSPEFFWIGRKQYPLAEMTAVVASEIRGTNRVRVKILLPLGIKKEIMEEIKDRCRKAGAKSFFILYKS